MQYTKTYRTEIVFSSFTRGDVHAVAKIMLNRMPLTWLKEPGPVSIERVLGIYGIEVRTDSVGSTGMLIERKSGWQAVVAPKENPAIRSYTLAHELGHWILHHQFGIDDATATERGFHNELEDTCDVFASLLLSPSVLVIDRLKDYEKLTFLALEHVARGLGVPLRAILHCVRGSEIPDRRNQCVMVLQPVPATNTLRILMTCTVLPRNMRLPANATAELLGLRGISDRWVSLVPGQEQGCNEVLTVLHDVVESEVLRSSWREARYRAEATYKSYYNPGEGLFVVGIFGALEAQE